VKEYTGMAEDYIRAAGELGYPRADLNGYYTQGKPRIRSPPAPIQCQNDKCALVLFYLMNFYRI